MCFFALKLMAKKIIIIKQNTSVRFLQFNVCVCGNPYVFFLLSQVTLTLHYFLTNENCSLEEMTCCKHTEKHKPLMAVVMYCVFKATNKTSEELELMHMMKLHAKPLYRGTWSHHSEYYI